MRFRIKSASSEAPNIAQHFTFKGHSMPTIVWHETVATGYTDDLPAEWFTDVGEVAGRVHTVTSPRGRLLTAYCDVKVGETWAELDYDVHSAANQAQGVYLGVMRLEFSGPDRQKVAMALWRDPGKSFESIKVTIR